MESSQCNNLWENDQQYARDIAVISLSMNPTYSIAAYYDCEKITAMMVSPHGNIYIASRHHVRTNAHNMIVQKTSTNDLSVSEWAAIENAQVDHSHWMYEVNNCELKIAAKAEYPDQKKVLRLIRLGC